MNDAVFDQARKWYEGAGQPDVAGPGFYMSADPMDSRGFGTDLLIVEVRNKEAFGYGDQVSVKKKADAALYRREFDGLPLVTRYNNTWHVVHRPPTAEEAKQVQFVFRRPNAGDVDAIWDQVGQPLEPNDPKPDAAEVRKLRMQMLGRMARDVVGDLTKNPSTRNSEILQHRILFDKAAELLRELPAEYLKPDEKENQGRYHTPFEDFADVMHAYQKILPAEPRTKALFDRWRIEAERNGWNVSHPRAVRVLAEGVPQLAEAERAQVAKWVPAKLAGAKWPKISATICACSMPSTSKSPTRSGPPGARSSKRPRRAIS
jgi:hypothetical protein